MNVTRRWLLYLGSTMALAFDAGVWAQAPPSQGKVPGQLDDVRVIGCLKQEGTDWLLTAATDPVANTTPKPRPTTEAAAPAAPMPPPGRHQFKLIGVDVFHLPTRKDQRVEVTGLLIPAKPISRLNITTVAPVAPTCAPAP